MLRDQAYISAAETLCKLRSWLKRQKGCIHTTFPTQFLETAALRPDPGENEPNCCLLMESGHGFRDRIYVVSKPEISGVEHNHFVADFPP
jgi:hypothetical protein